MVSVGLSFDDFDLVVDPFQLAGVDGILAVVEDTFPVPFEGVGEAVQGWMADGAGEPAPFLQGLLGTPAVRVR